MYRKSYWPRKPIEGTTVPRTSSGLQPPASSLAPTVPRLSSGLQPPVSSLASNVPRTSSSLQPPASSLAPKVLCISSGLRPPASSLTRCLAAVCLGFSWLGSAGDLYAGVAFNLDSLVARSTSGASAGSDQSHNDTDRAANNTDGQGRTLEQQIASALAHAAHPSQGSTTGSSTSAGGGSSVSAVIAPSQSALEQGGVSTGLVNLIKVALPSPPPSGLLRPPRAA